MRYISCLLLAVSVFSAVDLREVRADEAAPATPQLPVLIITDKGYSWMIQGDDGTPIVYKFSQVIVLGKPDISVPPVVPPTTGSVKERVTAWVSEIPVAKRTKLPAIITALNVITVAGKFTNLPEMEATIKTLLGIVLNDEDRVIWEKFGANLNNLITEFKKAGKVTNPIELAALLLEVIKALESVK